ncbi:MAG: tRNA preQ1(34) S-adenosylmethionine ribosyltransferase-isomerase QueA [Phycisphaerae bacterium]|jgi:S-adenosylmethionine:tRNA ribosyltransferase-isomerase
MRLADLHYDLPPNLIAQRPAEPRDASRLLVLHRDTGRIEHRTFRDLPEYLDPGDCLILNDTRVIPARFFCRRATGGRIEALFLREEAGLWHLLLKPSARLKVGERLTCDAGGDLILTDRGQRGAWQARPDPDVPAIEFLDRAGQPPLPPYIRPDTAGRHGEPDQADRERYQTVFANRPGAVAAPTAGLHFTSELLAHLSAAGVGQANVTLHVGLGTFAPIEVDDLADHPMHAEWYDIAAPALATLRQTRAAGGRLVAVGTTSVRVLESLPALDTAPASGWTNIFIYPPYTFRHVDRLITNFHLPGSTLLALVMAFATRDQILTAYTEAITRAYRFYSYGDAMLIL